MVEGGQFLLDAFESHRFDEVGIKVRLEIGHMVAIYPETIAEDTVGITKRRTAPLIS